VGRTSGDCNIVEERDRVMVCHSGGKNSYALLDILPAWRTKLGRGSPFETRTPVSSPSG